MTLTQLFTSIANAIRTKKGTEALIQAEDFADEISTIETGIDTSDATAEPINIRDGETAYVDGQKITGILPVLTYPVNPISPTDYNYQFIAATSTSKVTREGADYLLGSYQIASQSQPDSWMFEGNRKMKMGIPISSVVSLGDITANKIKTGETIYGVIGTYEGDLPFTQLNYIASTGSQYINTGVSPSSINKIEFEFAFTQESGTSSPLGARNTNSSNYDALTFVMNYANASNVMQLGFGHLASPWDNITGFRPSANVKHKLVLQYSNGSQKIYVDGVEKLSTTKAYSTSYLQNINLYLFATNINNTSVNYNGYTRLYSCKFYNGNTLVRDFIPVKRKSDNVICMFDKVTCSCYTNAGSGTFIQG